MVGTQTDAASKDASVLQGLVKRSVRGDVVELCELGATSGVRLDERRELELTGVQRFKLVVDAEMVAAEGARTNDGDARYALERRQGATSLRTVWGIPRPRGSGNRARGAARSGPRTSRRPVGRSRWIRRRYGRRSRAAR